MIILAIESAISGGSVSLLDDGSEIASWIGTSNVSKAEELLVNIDELLTSNNIKRDQIGLIAVSAGPGSFTGIRIGIATAMGLKTGLAIPMISVSLLDAMIHGMPSSLRVTSAVPVGRGAVCFQDFLLGDWSRTEESEPISISETDLIARVSIETDRHFMLYPSLYLEAAGVPNTTNVGKDLASHVGTRGFLDFLGNKPDVKPIFVSKSF